MNNDDDLVSAQEMIFEMLKMTQDAFHEQEVPLEIQLSFYASGILTLIRNFSENPEENIKKFDDFMRDMGVGGDIEHQEVPLFNRDNVVLQ